MSVGSCSWSTCNASGVAFSEAAFYCTSTQICGGVSTQRTATGTITGPGGGHGPTPPTTQAGHCVHVKRFVATGTIHSADAAAPQRAADALA
eukprot:6436987-Prymnesium_polylepis.1